MFLAEIFKSLVKAQDARINKLEDERDKRQHSITRLQAERNVLKRDYAAVRLAFESGTAELHRYKAALEKPEKERDRYKTEAERLKRGAKLLNPYGELDP